MVEQELMSWLASDNGLVVHLTIFVLLILGGFGFPIPEDIPILLGGVAGAKGIVALPAVFATCYAGVLLADQVVFCIGYFFGQRILSAGTNSRFLPSITPERIQEVREGLRKRRLLYIFVGRHLFPVRSVTFLTAGALRIPYWEFLIADALAALISVSIVLGVGYYLGEQLTPEVVSHIVHDLHYYITGLVALSLVVLLVRHWVRRKKRLSAFTPSEMAVTTEAIDARDTDLRHNSQ
ncbi:MAG: DedA family protein [Bdellovibrionales bacterium]|nr:DedA family protein [Bdellovibrionales bacterium]